MNKYLLPFFLIGIIMFVGYLSVPLINKSLGLPDLSDITEYEPISSIELYDYKDTFVGFLQAKEDRKVVPLSKISPNIKRAVLAIEDKDFYSHMGVDLVGIVRAFFTNLRAGRIVEGGSTITQQLVKNLLIPEEQRGRTYSRKIKEVLLALELERQVSKDKILELYLNQVYWGSRAYGVQRACQRYFAKQSDDVTLAEAAYLAGLLQAPSALSANREAAKKRQKEVLDRMYKFGFINKKQYESAINEKLHFASTPGNLELYPFYFSHVLEELNSRFDIKKLKAKGYKIYTSLDPAAQGIAERILNEEIKNAPNGVTQFAFSGVDVKTGQVRVIVGGVGDFWQHQWNRATNPHTFGSSFKPFVYLTGFQQGIIDTETIIKDSAIKIPDGQNVWEPRNYDHTHWGDITVRRALTFSRNIPAVKVARSAGIENVIQTARACGVSAKMEPNLSVALGSAAISPLEAAAAYATFARGGVYIKPIVIRRIEDGMGSIIEKNDPVPVRACQEYAVSSLVSILQDVVSMGTGTLARLPGRPVSGKTGTSDKSRDVWFTGFTPDFSASIWGGNDHNKPIHGSGVTGGAIVARVWQKVMEEYYEVHMVSPGEFPGEPNMKEYLIDPLTGLLATQYTSNPVKRRFYPGTEPVDYAPTPSGVTKLGSFFKFFANPSRRNRLVEFDESNKQGGNARVTTVKLNDNEKRDLIERAKKELNILDGEVETGESEYEKQTIEGYEQNEANDSVNIDNEIEILKKRIEKRLVDSQNEPSEVKVEDKIVNEEIEITIKDEPNQVIVGDDLKPIKKKATKTVD